MSATPCSKMRGPPHCSVALSLVLRGKAGVSSGEVFFPPEMLAFIPVGTVSPAVFLSHSLVEKRNLQVFAATEFPLSSFLHRAITRPSRRTAYPWSPGQPASVPFVTGRKRPGLPSHQESLAKLRGKGQAQKTSPHILGVPIEVIRTFVTASCG